MALFAAARRAASPLLLADADAAAFRRAASPLLLADAASPLLLAGAAAAATMTTPLFSVTTSLSASTQHAFRSATAENRDAATSLLLTGAAAAATLAPGAYTHRPAATGILGRRAVLFPSSLSHGTAFSSATLDRRATRCFSTDADVSEALTPELRSFLQHMDNASAQRHAQFLKELKEFELQIMANYSTAKLSSAETALTAGKVAWRVSTAVLAFGITTLVAVLQTVRDGWKVDFHGEVKRMLEEMMDNLKSELLAQLPKLVRKELEVIEAEKAASKK